MALNLRDGFKVVLLWKKCGSDWISNVR